MHEDHNQSTVLVVYDDYDEEQGVKGVWSTTVQAVRKIGILNTRELANNLRTLAKHMGSVFEGVSTTVNEYELRTVEIVVEITAKGDVKLVGSGMGGDMKGGIKLVLSRRDNQKEE